MDFGNGRLQLVSFQFLKCQHAAVFVYARPHVYGGALRAGRMSEDVSSVEIHQINKCLDYKRRISVLYSLQDIVSNPFKSSCSKLNRRIPNGNFHINAQVPTFFILRMSGKMPMNITNCGFRGSS
jgi:hypothetical protein